MSGAIGRPQGELARYVPGDAINILSEVVVERAKQQQKWGEQNHPDGTGYGGSRQQSNYSRGECDAAARDGSLTWRHILIEEVDEALAEWDTEALRTELIQVAAVAAAWVAAIDRRSA